MGRLGVELMKILRGCPSRLGLSPNSVAEMLKPQLPDQAVGGEFIGLGWVCDGAGEAFSFGHTGGDEGFIADFKLFPHLGAGGVIMTNGMQGSVLFSEALSSIGREYKWPGDPAPRPSMPTVLAKGLASDWESSSGRRIAVTEARGGAWLEFADQPPIELRACADDEVFAVGLNLRLRLGDGGSTLRWVQPGKLIRFERTLTAKGQPSPGIG